jgi:hypothetical protein
VDDYVVMSALACDADTMIQIGVFSHEVTLSVSQIRMTPKVRSIPPVSARGILWPPVLGAATITTQKSLHT